MNVRIFLPLLSILFAACASGSEETVSAKLCEAFQHAWAKQDADAIYALMAPDCVFRSSFVTHFGRDEIRETVLGWNLKHVQNTRNFVEEQSKVTDYYASSVGIIDFDILDDEGAVLESVKSNYIYIFTRKTGDDWKLQMLIYHESRKD